jgi:hypothetical protein
MHNSRCSQVARAVALIAVGCGHRTGAPPQPPAGANVGLVTPNLSMRPTPQPLFGASHVAFSATTLCASIDNVIRCLNGNTEPIDVTLAAPVDQFFVTNYIQGPTVGCARLRSKSVTCWIEDQVLPMPHFTDAVDIQSLSIGSNAGICVQKADGELSCFAFMGIKVRALDFAPFIDNGGRLPRARYVEGCLVSEIGQKAQVSCPSGQGGNPSDIERFYARGWTRWQSSYSSPIPQGKFPAAFYIGIDQNGTLHGVGANFFGQLGSGKRSTGNQESALAELGRVSAFTVSGSHVCAIVGGRVACWGESTAGQVPRREALQPALCKVDEQATKTTWRTTALRANQSSQESIRQCQAQPGALDCVLGHRGFDPDLAPANYHVYKTDGECLESSSPVNLLVERSPVFVPGLDDAVEIAATRDVSCALRANGAVRCWGKPAWFQLGRDGSPF